MPGSRLFSGYRVRPRWGAWRARADVPKRDRFAVDALPPGPDKRAMSHFGTAPRLFALLFTVAALAFPAGAHGQGRSSAGEEMRWFTWLQILENAPALGDTEAEVRRKLGASSGGGGYGRGLPCEIYVCQSGHGLNVAFFHGVAYRLIYKSSPQPFSPRELDAILRRARPGFSFRLDHYSPAGSETFWTDGDARQAKLSQPPEGGYLFEVERLLASSEREEIRRVATHFTPRKAKAASPAR